MKRCSGPVMTRTCAAHHQGNTTSLAHLVHAVMMPTQSVTSRISMRHDPMLPTFASELVQHACSALPITAYSLIAVPSLPGTFCDPCTSTGRGLPHYCLRAVLMGA